MAIASVITRGYGNGTVTGTIPLAVLRGYAVNPPAAIPFVLIRDLVSMGDLRGITGIGELREIESLGDRRRINIG